MNCNKRAKHWTDGGAATDLNIRDVTGIIARTQREENAENRRKCGNVLFERKAQARKCFGADPNETEVTLRNSWNNYSRKLTAGPAIKNML